VQPARDGEVVSRVTGFAQGTLTGRPDKGIPVSPGFRTGETNRTGMHHLSLFPPRG